MDRHYGNSRHTPGALTLRQEFSARGFEFSNSYEVGDIDAEVKTGIIKLGDALAWNKSLPIDAANRPRLTISENCSNTIESIEKWTWDIKSMSGSRTRALDNHYKYFCDCARYFVMSNPEIETSRVWETGSAPFFGVNT